MRSPLFWALFFTFSIMNQYLHAVTQLTRLARQTQHILRKAQEHSVKNSLSEDFLPSQRLIADMFPLAKQVQILSDNLKGATARFTHQEAPKMEDTETTLTQLIERLEKTIGWVESIPESAYEKASDAKASFFWMPGHYLSAEEYLYNNLIPNAYFHAVTAYSILRANGVELGKSDYLGELKWVKEA